MINVGRFNQRITVQKPSTSVDALGQRVETWTELATVWAQAQPLRGREYFSAGEVNSDAAVRFRLRYRSDVTGAMRVLWRDVPHAIVAEPIDVEGGRHTLELMCSAGIRDSA
jgi:SPP1 family predicted phage head-tail adaptor